MSKIINTVLLGTFIFFILPTNNITGKGCTGYTKLDQSAAKEDYTLVVSGTITEKKEIWDRRSNPLLGRPDILKEIKFKLEIITLIKGKLPKNTKQIDMSITKNQKLLAQNYLAEGDTGTFYLNSINKLYSVVDYTDIKKNTKPAENEPSPADTVKAPSLVSNLIKRDTITNEEIAQLLEKPDYIPWRLILKFENLKKAALQKIAKKYQLNNTMVVTLISHQGPRPPSGGYLYWGVSGRIKGKWHIWQPGKGLRQGKDLVDPKRYQK